VGAVGSKSQSVMLRYRIVLLKQRKEGLLLGYGIYGTYTAGSAFGEVKVFRFALVTEYKRICTD
jgi:hypothetical protein